MTLILVFFACKNKVVHMTFNSTNNRLVPILLLFLLNFQFLPAQEKLLPVFHFNRLTTADGLPTYVIRSPVVCDRQGFIWIGTVNGLARYDGYTCKVYRNIPGDPHSVSSNSINSLFLDSRGLLWIDLPPYYVPTGIIVNSFFRSNWLI